MKKLFVVLVLIALSFINDQPAHSRALLSTETVCTGVDVTVTTTAETVVGTVTAPTPQGNTFLMRVRSYGIVTTSADSASYKLRARRTGVAGTAIGDAIAQTVTVAAGSTEAFYFEGTDERAGQFSSLTYVSTIEIASASDASTVGWNCITVDYLQ